MAHRKRLVPTTTTDDHGDDTCVPVRQRNKEEGTALLSARVEVREEGGCVQAAVEF